MPPKIKVLVVDDEPIVCAGISRALQRHGYEVETTLDGGNALERVRQQPYDVILVDIMMPRMNGLELLGRLREHQNDARMLVITGLGAARHAVEAFRVGAFDFITKPFTSDELLSTTMRAASRPAERCASLPAPPAPRTYRLGTHSWVRLVEGGHALVGIQECFQQTAGRLVSIDLPNEGDELVQGELVARARGEGGGVFTVWCPISGRVVEANLGLGQRPGLANTDPYGEGWLVRVFPACFEAEAELLIPPAE
ncbi:MAG: response regulator [Deltaproteobacteria bacterium]|nr:response regulator [Deltaproteobacteria bacterium]